MEEFREIPFASIIITILLLAQILEFSSVSVSIEGDVFVSLRELKRKEDPKVQTKLDLPVNISGLISFSVKK